MKEVSTDIVEKTNKENKDFEIDFIGVGEAKSATSWIFRCLKEHPEICGSKPKEVYFFNKNYNKGIKWYKKHFEHCLDCFVKGEFTPSYLSFENVAERIKKHFPQVKLIVCLRSPLDTIVSKYYFDVSRGKTDININQRVEKMNLDFFLYYQKLSRFLKVFDRNQMLVLIYDDIKKDPKYFIQRVYEFLGVDASFAPSLVYGRSNKTVANTARFLCINKILWKTRGKLKKIPGGVYLTEFLKMAGVNYIVKKIFKMNRRKSKIKTAEKKYPKEELSRKVKDHCKDDIKKLEEFLGRDLGHWYK